MSSKLRQALPDLYEGARNLAASSLDAEPDLERVLPRACPYDWAAVTERDVKAEMGPELSDRREPARRRRKGKA
jgi:hypothetical protein